MKQVADEVFNKLLLLGIIDENGETPDNRQFNVGESNYSDSFIQPWSYIQDHNMDYLHGDIIKRITRSKPNEERKDLLKIKHICDEIIRQIDAKQKLNINDVILNDNED